MPIYEYQCQACGHQLEALQRMSDDPLKECPSCQQQLKKLVSASAFRLGGSGWYETDFKSGNKKNLAGDAGAAGDKSGDSQTGKAESKNTASQPADKSKPATSSATA